MTNHPFEATPTDLEIASNLITGLDDDPATHVDLRSGKDVLDALSTAVVPFLERSPCLVSFSGGRDSSTVLAVAARAARHHGLALPVPMTLRYPGFPAADESEWQERVVRHIGLADWQVQEFSTEMDFLGPYARRSLERCGVVWPTNAYVHLPIFEAASRGSVLTGFDGDGLFGGWPWVALGDALGLRRRPSLRDVGRLAKGASPIRLRNWYLGRKETLSIPWLQPEFERRVLDAWRYDRSSEPVRWPARLRRWSNRRYLSLGVRALALLAEPSDVRVGHPFIDPEVLGALANAGGVTGRGDRTAWMVSIFENELPRDVLTRETKANFSQPFWGPETRAFVSDWDGAGVDPKLVAAEALKAEWARGPAANRTASLIQWLWLWNRRQRADKHLGAGLES